MIYVSYCQIAIFGKRINYAYPSKILETYWVYKAHFYLFLLDANEYAGLGFKQWGA